MKSLKLKVKSWQRGFTLIELLIVIALIGILAVALLSAINPLEQLRKGRDSARKADAAELLNAIERLYTSYQCYPWSYAAGVCADPPTNLSGSVNPIFTGLTPNVDDLITVNELKQQFASRIETSGNPSYTNLFMTENVVAGGAGDVVVCFEPESTTGRTGGLGRITNITGATVVTCTGNYVGHSAAATCYICVPQ